MCIVLAIVSTCTCTFHRVCIKLFSIIWVETSPMIIVIPSLLISNQNNFNQALTPKCLLPAILYMKSKSTFLQNNFD